LNHVISQLLSGALLDVVIEEFALPVFVLDRARLLYSNAAARALAERLQREHATELAVLLRDHVDAVSSHLRDTGRLVSLVMAGNGEPFYIHLQRVKVEGQDPAVVACVRELAPERRAIQRYYGLTGREAEVLSFVLMGYGNRDIANALGIASATTKKHLTSIFDKVGVDSRSQLISRLT
jgi:DNA-binding CsgD family transcriptional regulator